MKPKIVIYLLFLGGSVLLIAIWAWSLSAGLTLLGSAGAITATAILCLGSSAIAARKIREDPRLSIGDVAAASRLIAVAPAVIGACVWIWERVPSRSGNGSHLDRRYAMLFFAIALYLVLFPILSSRRAR